MDVKITAAVEPDAGWTGIKEYIKDHYDAGTYEMNSINELLWLIKDVGAPIMFDGKTIVIMNAGYPQVFDDAPKY